MSEKQYLGDGVYVRRDGRMVCLTTENGIRTTNEIFLETEVLESLMEFFERELKVRIEYIGDATEDAPLHKD